MGSRAASNWQQGTSTPVDKHKVSTKLTNETPLIAWVEAAGTITKVNVPSPNATYQHTAIIDSSATSSCGWPNNPFITTGQVPTIIFHTPLGQTATATEQKELKHNLWQPGKMVDIVPTLKASHALLSTSKFAHANYITMFMPTAVQIYDEETTKITASQPSVHRVAKWTEQIMACPPHSTHTLKHKGTWNNMFELANSNQIIMYYHAAAGDPRKPTWLVAICKGCFATWSLLTEHAVNKHFPESAETAKGHMCQQCQGLRSTKPNSNNYYNQLQWQKKQDTYAETHCVHRSNWCLLIQIKHRKHVTYDLTTQMQFQCNQWKTDHQVKWAKHTNH